MHSQLPVSLRALWHGPVTNLGRVVRNSQAWWTPSLRRLRHAWKTTDLSSDAVNATLSAGVSPAVHCPGARNQNLLQVAATARALTPAIVRWCVTEDVEYGTRGRDPVTRADTLRTNPALTDALARVAQDAIEERLWRDYWAQQVWQTILRPIAGYRFDTRRQAMRFCVQTQAWILLQRAGNHRAWSPFLRTMVLAHLEAGQISWLLADAPDVPGDILRAVWNAARARPDTAGAGITGSLCRRTPAAVSLAECQAHVETRSPPVRAAYFAALPTAYRRVCWPSAYAAHPAATITVMAADGSTDWPGLTEAHLLPVCSAVDAAARLAAIQLLAQVPSHPSVDAPMAASAAPSPRVAADLPQRIVIPAAGTARTAGRATPARR